MDFPRRNLSESQYEKKHKSEGSFPLLLGSIPALPGTIAIHSCAQDTANAVAQQQQKQKCEYETSDDLVDYKSVASFCDKNIGVLC